MRVNPCRQCGSQRKRVIEQKSGPHSAAILCKDCGLFLGWMKKDVFEALKKSSARAIIE